MEDTIRRYTQKLYNQGKISCPFSIHDIRHYYITKRVNADPAYFNVQKIQKQVGHKNIVTTFSYINENCQ